MQLELRLNKKCVTKDSVRKYFILHKFAWLKALKQTKTSFK